MSAEKLRVLGLMTGTSSDALDLSCVEIGANGKSWRPLWNMAAAYPSKLRARVLAAQKPRTKLPLKWIMELHRDLGLWFAAASLAAIKRHATKGKPDLIASHGQTVAHHSALIYPDARLGRRAGTTLQLGDPSRVAEATGITVVSNFRDGDLAAGGEGAPLVPLFHRLITEQMMAKQVGRGVSILNIGGIANFTYVGPHSAFFAGDTGTGNIWIDAATERTTRGKQRFDEGGKIAETGEVDLRALKKILTNPYFKKPFPKSTGRDDFPFELLLKATRLRGASLVSTATWITVESIARAYEDFVLDRGLPLSVIAISGGGAQNPILVSGLAARLPEVSVTRLDDWGLDSKFIEAQAFAYFGSRALFGLPLGGHWTGSFRFGPPAHILPGANWRRIREWLIRAAKPGRSRR